MMRISPAALACALGLAAAPAAAQVRPVVDVRSGYLLGGTVDGRWVKADAMARRVRGGERYRVWSAGAAAGQATGARATSIGTPCEETTEVKLTPEVEHGDVAVAGTWNARPRPVTPLATTSAVYQAAVRDLLVRHGIARPEVRITRVLRADLDGDGRDEVLVSALRGSTTAGIHVDAGDYALLMVRTVVSGVVRTVMLEEEYHPRTSDQQILNRYEIAGIYDLDGDGRMEVLMHGAYYEGDWTTIYGFRDGAKRELAGAGCGV